MTSRIKEFQAGTLTTESKREEIELTHDLEMLLDQEEIDRPKPNNNISPQVYGS